MSEGVQGNRDAISAAFPARPCDPGSAAVAIPQGLNCSPPRPLLPLVRLVADEL
jgi:hypothetical protein